MGRVIIVQQIKSIWSKASRGGEGAVRRNAVPEAVKVPLHEVQMSGLILFHHKLSYGESDDFEAPWEQIVINPAVRPLAIGCVTIDDILDGVIARFVYNGKCGGAPDRRGMQKTLMLTNNQWGQIVYNGRFAPDWDGDWWYEKMTVNVGVFDPPSNSVFTRSEPMLRYAAIGHLF